MIWDRMTRSIQKPLLAKSLDKLGLASANPTLPIYQKNKPAEPAIFPKSLLAVPRLQFLFTFGNQRRNTLHHAIRVVIQRLSDFLAGTEKLADLL